MELHAVNPEDVCAVLTVFLGHLTEICEEMSELTIEDAGMHHANMVREVVAGLQEALKQDQVQTETSTVVQAPVDHVPNAVQNSQQQLATQQQHIQSMMQAMQMQYAAAPQGARQYYGVSKDYGGRVYHGYQSNYCGQEGRGAQHNSNWRGGWGGRVNSNLTHYCWTHEMWAHPGKY